MNASSQSSQAGAPAATGVRLMAHMIAYFPDREGSLAIARGLAAGGADYLEVQFPFSDPSADGRLIQTAGSLALEAGFRVKDGFDLVREIHEETRVPVYVMSYGNLVFHQGTERFVDQARSAGATGLIIPDLPPGYDEHLYAAGAERGLEIVPVVAPSVTDARLARIGEERPAHIYAALRVGITGSYTDIGEENLRFLGRLRTLGCEIIAGFGISTPKQVEHLAPHVHAVVVGSAFVKTVLEALEGDRVSEVEEQLRAQVAYLITGRTAR